MSGILTSMDIVTARKEKNLTQQALADAIGVSRAAVANWETGQAQPDVENAKALREKLGITLDQIYDGAAAA